MPSFPDSIFLFLLALLLFGPKRLPQLARELGKWVGEFRRASNEFKMQMQEELRVAEQEERQQKIAAIEAAAPVAPHAAAPIPDPEHPHLPQTSPITDPVAAETATPADPLSSEPAIAGTTAAAPQPASSAADQETAAVTGASSAGRAALNPVPIATSGELAMMPPSTGLPIAQARSGFAPASPAEPHISAAPANPSTAANETAPLSGLLERIPSADAATENATEPEAAAHG